MPLKDHARERWCAQAIAYLIRQHALKKLEAQGRLLSAMRQVAVNKSTEQVAGTTWGSW